MLSSTCCRSARLREDGLEEGLLTFCLARLRASVLRVSSAFVGRGLCRGAGGVTGEGELLGGSLATCLVSLASLKDELRVATRRAEFVLAASLCFASASVVSVLLPTFTTLLATDGVAFAFFTSCFASLSRGDVTGVVGDAFVKLLVFFSDVGSLVALLCFVTTLLTCSSGDFGSAADVVRFTAGGM